MWAVGPVCAQLRPQHLSFASFHLHAAPGARNDSLTISARGGKAGTASPFRHYAESRREGLEVKDEYHYTESGLRNVWLASGFRIVRSDQGDRLLIDAIEGLHAAIGRGIVKKEKKLTGAGDPVPADGAPHVAGRAVAPARRRPADRRPMGEGKGGYLHSCRRNLAAALVRSRRRPAIGWIASFATDPPNDGRMILRRENAAATVSRG